MSKRAGVEKREVILNLWLVFNKSVDIQGLRMQHYVVTGNDEEKLQLLQERSCQDYYAAAVVPIPERFFTIRVDGTEMCRVPAVKPEALELLGGPLVLFENAIRQLETEVLKQQDLVVPKDPLVCVTALLADDEGTFTPRIDHVVRF